MQKLIKFFLPVLFGACCAVPVLAQTSNTLYARNFPGSTVGQKVAAAQKACSPDASVPCVIVIGPTLAAFPAGTMPTKCAQCVWEDYRTGSPYLPTTGGKLTGSLEGPSLPYSVLAYGASASAADNSAAFNNAISAANVAGGGTVTIPAGTFDFTSALVMKSNVRLKGAGQGATVLHFAAQSGCSGPDCGGILMSGPVHSVNPNFNEIAAAVPAGSTSFTVSSASETAGLTPGQWIIMLEFDPGAGPNEVVATWDQVLSVSGATVNLVFPTSSTIPDLRAFSASPLSGPGFWTVTPVKNVSVSHLTIQVSNANDSTVALTALIAYQGVMNATFDHLTIDNANADHAQNASVMYTYLSKNIKFLDNNIVAQRGASMEIGATDGFIETGNSFADTYTANATSATIGFVTTLDQGTEQFEIANNTFANCQNTCISMVTGVHNGTIADNSFGYSQGSSPGNAVTGVGVQGVTIWGNSGQGGAGSGVSIENTSGYTVNIDDADNTVLANAFTGYTGGAVSGNNLSAADDYFLHNDFGALKIGSVTNGMQTQWGTVGAIYDSSGVLNSSGAKFSAFNAYMSSYSTKDWTQPYSSAGSWLHTLGVGSSKQSCYYYAPPGTAAGVFASFWGSPVSCIDSGGQVTAASVEGTEGVSFTVTNFGTGATASCLSGANCTALSGLVTVVAGTSPSGTGSVKISWTTPYFHLPVCTASDLADAVPYDPQYYAAQSSTTTATFLAHTTITAGDTYDFSYICTD